MHLTKEQRKFTQHRDLCSASDIIPVQEQSIAKHDVDKLFNFHHSVRYIDMSAMNKNLNMVYWLAVRWGGGGLFS